jgi:phosphoglycolate phosphatase-like HAD superfamily hydrolase
MKLIIFDMDQTLVELIEVHDEAARQLFQSFFGVDARLTNIDYAGKSLFESFHELAKMNNIPEETFLSKKAQLLQRYEDAFVRNIPADARIYILPGVEKLLAELAKTGDIIMLYTGDSKAIVEAVFNATGLGKYFSDCFYGTEVSKRADMITLALKRAKAITGRDFKGKDIVIIGDSLRDVEVGKQFSAMMISVATGVYSEDDLSRAGADYVFKDLSDYKQVINTINAS